MSQSADLISTAAAAAILGVSPRRVRQLRGDLCGQEIAGVLVFPRAVVETAAREPRPKAGYPKGRPRKPVADPAA
jgi:hypothetical protein